MKTKIASVIAFLLIVMLCALSLARPARTRADAVCFSALKELGDVYEFGVCEPGHAFDCSALVSYCFANAGIEVPPSAQNIGYTQNMTRNEDLTTLRRGDILCFDTVKDSDRSDHVGIYLGRGLFIHASSAKGRVTISRVSDYENVFSWALDFFEAR